jgi:hypothetical protein
MDNVKEKREQLAELYKLLAAEGYDVILLSVVLGNAGTPFKCFDRATKKMDIPNARKENHTASFTDTIYTVSKKRLVPMATAIPEKIKANCRSKGKIKRQIASLSTPTCL